MTSIVKVWLQFPADAEESYTSLPCTPETTGRELGAKLTVAIKKKRGLEIELGAGTHSTAQHATMGAEERRQALTAFSRLGL